MPRQERTSHGRTGPLLRGRGCRSRSGRLARNTRDASGRRVLLLRLRLLAASKQPPLMRTLYIRHVPDEVAAGLEKLAAQAGLPLSTFALQELTESARRADNAELLNALPSVPIDRATILDALAESRAER